MERWLKRGQDQTAVMAADKKVRETVETILADIASRGDTAIRELSIKFDGWDRENYRLTDAEIEGCLSRLSKRDIADINVRADTGPQFRAASAGRDSRHRG